MTYCVAAAVDAGLVFASDSRTHAGVDHISSYRKTHRFVREGERVFVLCSAGNLAITQAVIKRLERDIEDAERSLYDVAHMDEAADYLGCVNRETQSRYGDGGPQKVNLEATFIFGGQIRGEPPSLFLVYPEGNFIEYSSEQPFFQIGETKYGKPILDRIITPALSLEDAARCMLVSIDSTMRSNLSVAPPVDLTLYRRDGFAIDHELRYKLHSPYFASVRKHWNEGLRRAFHELPRFEWEDASAKGETES